MRHSPRPLTRPTLAANSSRQERRRQYVPFILKRVGQNLYRGDSGNYFGIVKHDGRQIRRSLKTSNPILAKRRLEDFRKQVQFINPASKDIAGLTFSALAWRWFDFVKDDVKPSTAERHKYAIKSLATVFGHMAVSKISRITVEDWAIKRGRKCNPATFNKELDALRQILRYAVEHGALLSNPTESIKRRRIPQPKILIPTKEQWDPLESTCRHASLSIL